MAKQRFKVDDDLVCSACKTKLSNKNKLYETGWGGVYWCGFSQCAMVIMRRNCDKLKYSDPCNHV